MKEFKFKISGQDYSASVEENGSSLVVTVNGQAYQVEVPQTKSAAPKMARATSGAAQAGGPKNINSELPGTVTKIVAANGQHVKKGDVLLVIEAMKMANDIVSDVEGTVQRIAVTEGQSVNQGDLLVEMVADAVAAPAAASAPAPVAKAAPAAAPASAPAAPKAAVGAKVVEAPLPGTITKMLVKPGQALKAGETVCMMEAMKMENSITVEFAGTVKAVLVEAGAQVQSGQALVELD